MRKIIAIGCHGENIKFSSEDECCRKFGLKPGTLKRLLTTGDSYGGYCFDEQLNEEKNEKQ